MHTTAWEQFRGGDETLKCLSIHFVQLCHASQSQGVWGFPRIYIFHALYMHSNFHYTVATEHREPQYFKLAQKLIFRHYNKWSSKHQQCSIGQGSDQISLHQNQWRFKSHQGILIFFKFPQTLRATFGFQQKIGN